MARNGTKTGGRKKGSVNQKTKAELDRAERVLSLIENTYLENDIEALSSHQRMMLYADMMEYRAPKLSRVDTNITGGLVINWNDNTGE